MLNIISLYWQSGKASGLMTFRHLASAARMADSFAEGVVYKITLGYHG